MDVIVLVGGLGTRLKGVISDVPKPMAPVGGAPFLDILLNQLLCHSVIERVVMAVGYKREVVQNYFGDRAYNRKIIYAIEKSPSVPAAVFATPSPIPALPKSSWSTATPFLRSILPPWSKATGSVRQFNHNQPLPLRLTTHSDAPTGSVLGSSSTLVVAMVAAYVEWLKLPLGEYEIAKLACEIERIDVGLSGGRQDTYAATFGGFNFIEFYEQERVIVNPLRIKNWMINELESSLVLHYTQISRKSADVIDEQIKNIKNHSDDALAATHAIKQGAVDMKEAILKGNTRQMAELLGQAWAAKKESRKASPARLLRRLTKPRCRAGAYSGKVSGAGGGGFIMFMVYPERKMNVTRALQKLGGQVTRFHFTPHGTQSWTV